MTASRQVNEPSPTIVGPRPAEGAGGKMSIPQGLERLLTLAGISPEWRGRVLADPLAAADEADIGLSASETAILKATPRPAIEQMCDSFALRHGRSVLGRAAAGVAAAALLATSLTGCGDDPPPPVKGIRPDVPRPGAAAPEVPPIQWQGSLDAALAEARRTNRAVMAVFPHPKPPVNWENYPRGSQGVRPDPVNLTAEQKSQKVVLTDAKEFRTAALNARLLALRLTKPVPPPATKPEEPPAEAYRQDLAAYEAALKKYGLEEKSLPAVVFLAPDGSELSKLVQPQEEAALIAAIKYVPPQLAKWIADQRKNEPPPPPSAGTRPPERYPR